MSDEIVYKELYRQTREVEDQEISSEGYLDVNDALKPGDIAFSVNEQKASKKFGLVKYARRFFSWFSELFRIVVFLKNKQKLVTKLSFLYFLLNLSYAFQIMISWCFNFLMHKNCLKNFFQLRIEFLSSLNNS